MGFIPDVERIVGLLSKSRQTLFFSATMPPEIRKLADAFLKDPAEVSVTPPASPAELVEQSLVVIEPQDKREGLRRLIASEDVKNALIFCNRKRDVDILFRSLKRHGFDTAALHGDMAQPVRTETLERFKKGEIRLLVCSDVAARGLDIQGLSHVFCFDVPYHAEDYVHRIGRTGRAGREGRSFMLAAPEDGRSVAAIVKLIGKDIPPATIDGIAEAKLDFDGDHRAYGRRPARPTAQRERSRAAAPEARPHRRPEHKPAAPRPVPAARPAPAERSNVMPFPRNGERPAPRRQHELPDERVVGFGNDLPAFLARPPVNLAPR
jgi:superfamily II DNA/RNA helicase